MVKTKPTKKAAISAASQVERESSIETIKQTLIPKKTVTIQKSIKFERDLFEAAVALCWYKRRTFTPWLKKLIVDTVAKEFVACKLEISLQELVSQFRVAAESNPEIADVLSSIYLKENIR